MSYPIDTNVFSEPLRSKPDATVLDCFANTPDEALFLSVLTLGEIRKDVENACRHPAPRKTARLAGA